TPDARILLRRGPGQTPGRLCPTPRVTRGRTPHTLKPITNGFFSWAVGVFFAAHAEIVDNRRPRQTMGRFPLAAEVITGRALDAGITLTGRCRRSTVRR